MAVPDSKETVSSQVSQKRLCLLTGILRSIIHPFVGVREPVGDNHVAVCGGQLAILEQAYVISSSGEQ